MPAIDLGRPLSIREVAKLIGCSAWTVRQKYVPRGLPHLRSGPSGRLTFFENQVVHWVLAQQQMKGGTKSWLSTSAEAPSRPTCG